MATPLKIEYWPIERLLPYAANARTHSPAQVEQLANSIKEFGFTVPCLVDARGELVAGHGRLLAAKRLGMTEVPVVVLGYLTDQQIRAYRIADNQLALNSGWDATLLLAELERLREEGIDPRLLGFADDDIGSLLAGINSGANEQRERATAHLADQFGLPPFSVLNAREGWWQARKAAWLSLGIRSELGRGVNLLERSPQDLFCMATGIHYGEARKIVTDAMAAQGEAFDLQALIAKHARAPA